MALLPILRLQCNYSTAKPDLSSPAEVNPAHCSAMSILYLPPARTSPPLMYGFYTAYHYSLRLRCLEASANTWTLGESLRVPGPYCTKRGLVTTFMASYFQTVWKKGKPAPELAIRGRSP